MRPIVSDRTSNSELPWKVLREGSLCGEFASHQEAQAAIQQLTKLYPPGTKLIAQYAGRNVSHCGQGGKPL